MTTTVDVDSTYRIIPADHPDRPWAVVHPRKWPHRHPQAVMFATLEEADAYLSRRRTGISK